MAREVDLLSFLQANEPHELRRVGNEYRMVTHSSLVISNGKWIWNRGGIGGRSALDFLIKMRGMGFVEAVNTVLDARGSRTFAALPVKSPKLHSENLKPPPKRELILPPINRYGTQAVGYLQKRGISAGVINRCIQAGLLYEGRYKGLPVCVFVGRDEAGKGRFACMRGVCTDLKQDCAGSDKRYSFNLPANGANSPHLAVFEAPIDALSHAVLQEKNGWNWDGYRLSIGGTSDVALMAFLERTPQIKRITLHLDNDSAGLAAMQKIKARLDADRRFKGVKISINPPRNAKDYNAALISLIERERGEKQRNRPQNRENLSL